MQNRFSVEDVVHNSACSVCLHLEWNYLEKHEYIPVENTSVETTFAFKQKWNFKIARSISLSGHNRAMY